MDDKWFYIISALIGGVFVILGVFIQTFIQDSKEKNKKLYESKKDLLFLFMGNRTALAAVENQADEYRINVYRKDFYTSLSQINLVFNENKDVLESHNKLLAGLGSGTGDNDELLFELVKNMYLDLEIINIPTREQFKKIVY